MLGGSPKLEGSCPSHLSIISLVTVIKYLTRNKGREEGFVLITI